MNYAELAKHANAAAAAGDYGRAAGMYAYMCDKEKTFEYLRMAAPKLLTVGADLLRGVEDAENLGNLWIAAAIWTLAQWRANNRGKFAGMARADIPWQFDRQYFERFYQNARAAFVADFGDVRLSR